jgi:glyceraldehyde 3-phosphate dehydrogenase
MTIDVGINGFGRIGRMVFRILHARRDLFRVVAINDLGDAHTMAHLLKYDSTQGRFDGDVTLDGTTLVVDGWRVPMLSERDPAKLPWAQHGKPMVVESTGVFRTRAQLEGHLRAGASKVLLTVPPKDEVDALIVLGVNDEQLKPEHKIVSNASCTTNCLAPVAKVLHQAFGIEEGLMNTIHAYTNDQVILDMPHKDLRRARSAGVNIIPTTTGAARAVGKVMPELNGKLDGFAIRVPVATGSMVDLTVILAKAATVEEINAAMKAAAEGPMKGILRYTDEPLVSTDIIGDPHSSIFDSGLTMSKGRFAKVCSWYDNEWGYSERCADMLERMAAPVPQTA